MTDIVDRAGGRPECTTCGRTKNPVGRSAPLGYGGCNSHDCEGYYKKPSPDTLWPGELQSEFGYGCVLAPDHEGECVFA